MPPTKVHPGNSGAQEGRCSHARGPQSSPDGGGDAQGGPCRGKPMNWDGGGLWWCVGGVKSLHSTLEGGGVATLDAPCRTC